MNRGAGMLKLVDANLGFDGKAVLHDLSLELEAGKTYCVLGPSGSGKSTLLRVFCGLQSLNEGSLTKASSAPKAQDPKIAYLAQDFHLFEHLSVRQNLELAMKEECDEFNGLCDDFEIGELLDRSIVGLSGGEQQRVALVRTLLQPSDLLLLDEPFEHLDRVIKEKLFPIVKKLFQQHKTVLFVTHDKEEAFALADHCLLLTDGTLAHQGTPESVYFDAPTPELANMTGECIHLSEEDRRTLGGKCPDFCRPQEIVPTDDEPRNAVLEGIHFSGTIYSLSWKLDSGYSIDTYATSCKGLNEGDRKRLLYLKGGQA